MLSSYRGNSGASSPQASNKPIQVTPIAGSTFDIAIGDTDVLLGVQNDLLTTDANGKLSQLLPVAGAGISIGIAGGNITFTNTAPATGGITIGSAVTGGGANRVLFEDASQNVAADVDMQFNGTQLQLATQGATGGILIGSDTQLYRDAADVIRTPDSITIDSNLSVGGISAFINTTDASSTATGAVQLSGGMGVTKKIFAGDNINTAGSFITSNTIAFSGTFIGNVDIAAGVVRMRMNNSTDSITFYTNNLAGLTLSGASAGTLAASFPGTHTVTFDRGYRATNQTDGAGASVGTITNAPSAGNPAFWLPVTINGSNRYIPSWS